MITKKTYICRPKNRAMDEKQLREEFKLRLSGVEDGNYCFSVVCDKTFFEIAQIEDLHDGNLNLQIEMAKSEKMVDLKFHFQGNVVALCDRCLLPVTIPLDFDERLYVKLVPVVEEDMNEDDDIWMIDENTYELDVFHFVYESIFLALPHRIVHEDDENGNPTCDPAVIEKLNQLSQQKDENETDPRWDALKNLKLD